MEEAIIAWAIRNSKVADIQCRTEGVPDPDWRFRTEEASAWSWYRLTGDDGENTADKRNVIRAAPIGSLGAFRREPWYVLGGIVRGPAADQSPKYTHLIRLAVLQPSVSDGVSSSC
jgi:hypothetical protein